MLAAAPALAQTKSAAPTLKLGGYYDQKMSYVDQDTAGLDTTVDVRNDVEIYFLGDVTLDNGIKIATRIELEGGTVGTGSLGSDGGNSVDGAGTGFDQIDEAFMTISGSFGSIKAGMADSAPKSITTGLQAVWFANVGENVSFNATKLVVRPATVTARATPAAQMDLSSDGEQVSYTTPSMAGFIASISYAQNTLETFDGQINTVATAADTDIWAMAVKYSGKFDNVGFNLGGGYSVNNEGSTAGKENDQQWMIGGNVTFSGIKLAASYSRQVEAKAAGATSTAGVNTYELGAQYTMGPNSFSAVYSESKAKSTVAAADGDKEKVLAVAYARALGKGVTWHNTLFWLDQKDANPAGTNATSNEGYALTTGLLVKF
jgi:outer membrane protein OmpU